jgi:hypothetical protein
MLGMNGVPAIRQQVLRGVSSARAERTHAGLDGVDGGAAKADLAYCDCGGAASPIEKRHFRYRMMMQLGKIVPRRVP